MTDLDKLKDAIDNLGEEVRAYSPEENAGHDCGPGEYVGDFLTVGDLRALHQALARRAGGEGEFHRWNIERDGNDLLICDGLHDKCEPCEYVRYSPAPDSAPGGGEETLIAIIRSWLKTPDAGRIAIRFQWRDMVSLASYLNAALRQPDTAGDEIAGLEVTEAICRDRIERKTMTADTLRDTITRWLNADDPTHWGEFEKRLAVAVGMDPFAAEDACMASGEGGVERTMAGESVCGFQVAAWRYHAHKDDPAHGHRYCEHWSTPGNGAWGVERMFTETDLRAALRTTPADPRPDPRDEALREARAFAADMSFAFSHDSYYAGRQKRADQLVAKIDAVIGGAG